MKKGENLHFNNDKGSVNILRLPAKTKKQARNYYFECDWLIELSDNKLTNNKLSNNKLSDNNLASELVENMTFLNQSQARTL